MMPRSFSTFLSIVDGERIREAVDSIRIDRHPTPDQILAYGRTFMAVMTGPFRGFITHLRDRGELAPIDAIGGEDLFIGAAWNRMVDGEESNQDWETLCVGLVGPMLSVAKLASMQNDDSRSVFRTELVRLVDTGRIIGMKDGKRSDGTAIALRSNRWMLRAVAILKDGEVDLRDLKRREKAKP